MSDEIIARLRKILGDIAPDLVASLPEQDFFADPLNPGDQVAVSWTDGDAHTLS